MTSLGTGGFGHCGLWTQLDHNQNIINRLAVKETYLKPAPWVGKMYWWGEGDQRYKREAYMQEKLSELSPSGRRFVEFITNVTHEDRHIPIS